MVNELAFYKRFKESQNKEDSFRFWEENSGRFELGVSNIDTQRKKLSLRASDNTPSTAIYEGLMAVDFGGDFKGDPISRVMETQNMSFPQALKIVVSWIGGDTLLLNKDFTPIQNKEKEVAKPYNELYLRGTRLDTVEYQERYNLLKKDLFRGNCSKEEIKRGENLFQIGFIPKNEYSLEDRIFIPEFDKNSIAWGSYRYNRSSSFNKGLLRKNGKRVLFPANLISHFRKDIILSEGHTDTVVNNAKSLACITTGSSTKRFDSNISELKGKHLHDFPDLDIPGMIGAINRGLEIDKFNSTASIEDRIEHTIYWWAEWLTDKKLANKILNNKLVESDLLFNIKDYLPIKKEHVCINTDMLQIIEDKYFKKRNISLPERLKIKNWTLLSKKAKKSGYDWIDFHEENHSSKNYLNFIEKFRY